MRIPDKSSILLTCALLLTAVTASVGQEPKPVESSRQILPSVVRLTITHANGAAISATGFLAVKDGMLVTALHVLAGATRVTATFPNGEEFDCPGIVDKDERRNLALVRINAFGRPALPTTTTEVGAGDKAWCPVVKDGAFGVVETRVAEVVVLGGVKLYRLAGNLPEGSNGSPVMNARGEVVGMHATLGQDGKGVEMALPSIHILALEPSLPVQPWAQASPKAAPGDSRVTSARDGIDASLATAAEKPKSGPVSEARDAILAAAESQYMMIPVLQNHERQVAYYTIHPGLIRLKGNSFGVWIPAPDSPLYKVDLRTVSPVSVECKKRDRRYQCILKSAESDFLANADRSHAPVVFTDSASLSKCPADCVKAAESLAAALNRLRALASDDDGDMREFRQRAAAWRALPSKPALPEEVRKHRILAESAAKEKNLALAMTHYEAALEMYSTWPEGHSSLALIAAELREYEVAIEHMQAYLELAPEAADAESARDRIVVWQDKVDRAK